MKTLRRNSRTAFLCCSVLGTAGLLCALVASALVASAPSAAGAAQVRVPKIALHQAAGRALFTITKDTLIVAAADDGAAAASRAPGGTPARMPGIVPLGASHVAIVMGATDWTRDDGTPVQLDEEMPAMVRKVFSSTQNAGPLDQSANDIEAIGVTVLEFVRPFIDDIHYKLNMAEDEPLIEILLAGYTEGYGFEIWDLKYRVTQRNLGNDYWDTRPVRPAYYQMYPPEKGKPRTFVEAQYPSRLAPLGLANAAKSDPAVSRIQTSSKEINEAVTLILNGESVKANTRPTEDFVRLALPVVAGAQSQLAIAAMDLQGRFQWLLAPENTPGAAKPAQTSSQPEPPLRQQEQTDKPSLRRAGPPTTQ